MGMLDSLFSSGDDSAQKYLQQALAQYQNIQAPSIESEKVSGLPQESVQGTLTPEEIKAVDQDESAYNNISLDPSSRQAMMNALKGFQTVGDEGGLDANAKLGIQQVLDATNNQSRGEQGAIQQKAQEMGQGGGDFALTQRAIAAQGASNNAATQGLQQAAMAEANREAALAGMANIGSQINASDYSQAANKAAAQNTINATNQGYRNAANTGNVSNNMAGQQFNISNAQAVNAANTTAGQNNAYYNAGLPQQKFNNEIAKANGMAGVNNNQANAANAAAANQAAMTGKLLGVAGTIGGAAIGGPAGAAVGGSLGNAAQQPRVAKSNDASAGFGAAKGGVVPCYAIGGVASPHDHALCMKMGGHVAGEAAVAGDSEQNDTVPALLSPGELVIPRSVPKDGPHMEEFARRAPVAGDPSKRVDLTSFVKGYKRGR